MSDTFKGRILGILSDQSTIGQENIAYVRDHATLSHRLNEISLCIRAVHDHLEHSDIEDSHDVERALDGFGGPTEAYTSAQEAMIMHAGLSEALELHAENMGGEATVQSLCWQVESDLDDAVRQLVTVTAESVETEMEGEEECDICGVEGCTQK